MLHDPQLHVHLATRRNTEAQARAKRAYELRSAGVPSGTRAVSASVLRWLADRVDTAPLPPAHSPEGYRPQA